MNYREHFEKKFNRGKIVMAITWLLGAVFMFATIEFSTKVIMVGLPFIIFMGCIIHMIFSNKCPGCNTKLIDAASANELNFCSKCGFDFNEEIQL